MRFFILTLLPEVWEIVKGQTFHESHRFLHLSQRVIDGDTIELVNGQIVRYVGVNALNNGEPFEERAIEENAKLVQNKTITLEYDAYASDRFGRVLGYPLVNV